MATSDGSWSAGPADSRFVRVCCYLAEGCVGGAILYGSFSLRSSVGGDARTIVVVLLIGLGAVISEKTLSLLLERLSSPRGQSRWTRLDRSGAWIAREWLAVRRWRWSLGLVVLVVSLLVLGRLAVPAWFASTGQALVDVLALVGLASGALAYLSSSAGDIDPETSTLTYWKLPVTVISERGAVDLRCLHAVYSFRLWNCTVLWLSFVDGTPHRFWLQGFYVVPTAVVDRYWATFQSGRTAEVTQPAKNSALRRESLAVLAGWGVVSILAIATIVQIGGTLAVLIPAVLLSLAVGGGVFVAATFAM